MMNTFSLILLENPLLVVRRTCPQFTANEIEGNQRTCEPSAPVNAAIFLFLSSLSLSLCISLLISHSRINSNIPVPIVLCKTGAAVGRFVRDVIISVCDFTTKSLSLFFSLGDVSESSLTSVAFLQFSSSIPFHLGSGDSVICDLHGQNCQEERNVCERADSPSFARLLAPRDTRRSTVWTLLWFMLRSCNFIGVSR